MMARVFSIAMLTLALAGCDFLKDIGKNFTEGQPANLRPTLVFLPDYKFSVNGEFMPVMGMDECPVAKGLVQSLFSASSYEGKSNCIVIAPDTENVKVLVRRPEGVSMEFWSVKQTADQVRLFTGDGTPVTASR